MTTPVSCNMNRFTSFPDYLSTMTLKLVAFGFPLNTPKTSTCNSSVNVGVVGLCLCVALRRLHPWGSWGKFKRNWVQHRHWLGTDGWRSVCRPGLYVFVSFRWVVSLLRFVPAMGVKKKKICLAKNHFWQIGCGWSDWSHGSYGPVEKLNAKWGHWPCLRLIIQPSALAKLTSSIYHYKRHREALNPLICQAMLHQTSSCFYCCLISLLSEMMEMHLQALFLE